MKEETPEEVFKRLFPNKNLPQWANANCEELTNWTPINTTAGYVPLAKVIGSTHQRYYGNSWLVNLYNLKRRYEYDQNPERIATIDETVVNNPSGYVRNDGVTLIYFQEEDSYYVAGGNHRMILLKFRGDDRIYVNQIIYSKRR